MQSLIKIILLALITGWSASSGAHEIRPAMATLTFPDARHYEIEVSLNLEAVLAGVSPAHQDTNESPNARAYDQLRALKPERLRERFDQYVAHFVRGVAVEFDGQQVEPVIQGVDIPAMGDMRVARSTRIRLGGEIPDGARALRWSWMAGQGNSILRVPGAEPNGVTALWLTDGQKSARYVLGTGLETPSRLEIIGQYIVIGFTHILPKGLDHILFVLGLFLLAVHWRPLLWQVTAFTLAHTLTLGLSIYGVIALSPAIVEPLIAASIVYVAVENLLTTRLHAWRVGLVFGFGLLHGLGFAGVLQEVGLPREEFMTGLISFNVGVELGQLAVIALAFLAVSWFRDRPWYRQRIVIPGSALIALTGAWWTIERVFL
jgi:hypothetical protein